MKTLSCWATPTDPTCPFLAQLQNREEGSPGVRNRDISGLMDGGTYISEAYPGVTPQCVWQLAGRTRAAVFIGEGGGNFGTD